MLRGVFFDLYGTLIVYGDMQAGWRDQITVIHRYIVHKGAAISTDLLASYYQKVMQRAVMPSLDGTSPFERRLDDVCREIGLTLNDYEISELADLSVNAWQRCTTLDPQAVLALKTIHQSFKTALITNYDYPQHIQRILREMELSPHFDAVLISGAVGSSKPERRMFDMALAKTGLQPSEAVFVGDSLEDIQGALAAGIQPIYLHRPSTPLLDLGNLPGVKVISDLSWLLEWLGSDRHS